MIRHHTIQSKWTDEGHRAIISLPCEPWSQPAQPSEPAPVSVAIEKDQFRKNWTDADIETLRKLHSRGLSLREIGQYMGRSKSSVEGKLRRMRK
jgi:DNA-directed RNA polymerase specialized sigma24 family protein